MSLFAKVYINPRFQNLSNSSSVEWINSHKATFPLCIESFPNDGARIATRENLLNTFISLWGSNKGIVEVCFSDEPEFNLP